MNKMPLLISYAYRDAFDWGMIREHRDHLDLLVDSGAFTAYKQGTDITVAEYCEWLNWLHAEILEPTGYFTLDVIGNPQGTLVNYSEMLQAGYKPIPIFTRGDHPDAIEEMFQTSMAEAGLVGIGGIQMKTNNSAGYLKMLMKHVGKRNVHWLGFTVQDFLLYYKPYSADSINWKGTALFGNIKLLTPNGQFKTVTKGNFWHYNFMVQIAKLGFDSMELADDEAWKGGKGLAHRIATASYLEYMDEMKKRTGTKVYPVVNNTTEFEVIITEHIRRNS
jgi:hypothetical protein